MDAAGGVPSGGVPSGGAPVRCGVPIRHFGAMRRSDPTLRQLPRKSVRYAG